jgi:hypothetical protein
VSVEDSHKISGVCCLLGHEVFSFAHDLLHRVYHSVVHKMQFERLISFVLLIATMIVYMHVVAK